MISIVQYFKLPIIIAISISLLLTSACGKREGITPDEQEPVSPLQTENRHNQIDNNFKILSQQTDQIAIPLVKHEGKEYVSLERLIDVLQFNSEMDPSDQSIGIGDNDIAYKLFFDVSQFEKEGEVVPLDDSPIVLNNQPLLPTLAIKTVFGEAMTYHLTQDSLLVYPTNTTVTRDQIDSEEDVADEALDFGEDPNDPLKNVNVEEDIQNDANLGDAAETFSEKGANDFADAVPAAALKNIDISSMIRFGRQYLGVNYDFGAKPYAQSKRFDCSSFTQHVYKKYGVKLNRLSRNQAKQGNAISRKSLRKGDLMFFYVPGRFKTNKTVGHVGIYIGNNKMLHSSPKPENGVQITNINKAFWKKTFLRARRVVK